MQKANDCIQRPKNIKSILEHFFIVLHLNHIIEHFYYTIYGYLFIRWEAMNSTPSGSATFILCQT